MKTRKPAKSESENKIPPIVTTGFFKPPAESGCPMNQTTNINITVGDNSDCMTGCFDFLKSLVKR